MSKSLFVKITQGLSIGPYSIYYNAVQPNNYAFLYGTTTNATNVPLSALTTGSGVRITIPNEATSVIVENANGDCLNYKTFSIAEFESVTSACTGYYDGTATINVTISGDNDLYQYSRDGGVTFSASTSEKSYSFTNVPNGNHNIVVKNVSDGVTISYESNPVVLNCAPVLVTSFLGDCFLNPPPDETYFAYIFITATGGSGTYKYAIQKAGGTKTTPQTSNAFNNLDPIAQYTMFVYDVNNTVNPNYEVTVGTTTFNCPAPVPPVTFTTTVGCAPTNFVGTGTILANNFAGGTGVYMYIALGTTEAEVRAILADNSGTTSRINLDGATSYLWKRLDNGSYFVGIQDSQSRITVVQTSAVSCTVIEPPNKQFLAYNVDTNSCNKIGVGTRYWTYDTTLADGYYKVNGGTTVFKFETVTNISQRGTYIDSIVSSPCVLTNVTLSPSVTDFGSNAYLLFVNNVAYQSFKTGTNSYPVGSVIKLSFNAGGEVCGVTLNGQPYTANTNVTLAENTNYNFVINATNSYVPQGAVYCENNQSKRLFVNACGTQDIRIIEPCSTACTSTTYTETCSGAYGQNVLRTFKYTCNGALTGQTTTLTCGSCSSVTPDWVVQSYECVPNDCNLREVQKQMNPCAPNFNTTRVINTNQINCQCGATCSNPPTYTETSLCGDFYSQTVTTKASCTGEVISVVNNTCVPGCGANPNEEWTNTGAVQCYGTCIKKQKQVQTNYCATANNYGAERFVDVGGNTCDCGETCLGPETYYFCSNKDLYTVQRYYCPPKTFIGIPQLLTLCSDQCTSKSPEYTSQNYSACYVPPTGSNNCSTGVVYKDTNRCSNTYNDYFIEVAGNKINVGPGQPSQGACNTSPVWINTGAFNCYGTCNSYYVQRNENRCSSTFGQTRQGDLYQTNTTFCGGCCGLPTNQTQGAQVGTYWSCSGGVVSSAPVYENSNICYDGPNDWLLNGVWISTNPSNNEPSTDPVWDNEGAPFCGTGGSLSTCQVYQKQVNINACSTATVRYVDQGPSNDCGTWEPYAYCYPAYDVYPYTYLTGQENTCTGERRYQTSTNNSPNCKPQEYIGFSMSASGTDAATACGNEIGGFLNAYCLGGIPTIGVQVVDSPINGSVYPDGFYHINPDNWISITGGNGVISSNGACGF